MKFIPTATLGIVAREYEQKQLAFLIQTLGAQSPFTPILMQSVIKNSSLSNREEMISQLQKSGQPDPQQQQMQQQGIQLEMAGKQADVEKKQAETAKIKVEADIAPKIANARMIAALSNNLDDNNEGKDFERRAKIAELMLKEKDITSNENIAKMQMEAKRASESDYMKQATGE